VGAASQVVAGLYREAKVQFNRTINVDTCHEDELNQRHHLANQHEESPKNDTEAYRHGIDNVCLNRGSFVNEKDGIGLDH
jgi:hypothetical protein